MNAARKFTALLAATLALASCADDLPTASEHPIPVGPAEAKMMLLSQEFAPDDPAMIMREELRTMSDNALLRELERTGNIVMIGFKLEGGVRGVSAQGEALVPAAEKAQRLLAVERLAEHVIRRFEGIPAIGVKLPNAQIALQLRRLPWVDYVAPGGSGLVTPDIATSSSSTVSCYNNYGSAPPPQSPQALPWNIQRIRANQAWTVAGRGEGNITVLDDGMDEGPNNLSPVELPWNFKRYYAPTSAVNGQHGTPVAGAAFAHDNNLGTVGTAPRATGRIYKVYDPNDQNWELYSAWAIDHARAYSKVITISYSTKQTSSSPPSAQVGLYDAIRNAYYQSGVLFTASTGNQSRADFYAYPARYSEVIGVGGAGYNDEYVLNNYAPGNVEVAAPALDISTVCKGGGIGVETGTSFATPLVAGALMVLRGKYPNESNGQLRDRLRSTAISMGNSQKSGAGRIDLLGAVNLVRVHIDGETYVRSPGIYRYEAFPSGGNGSYTYQWAIRYPDIGGGWGNLGTSKTQDLNIAEGDGDIELRVTATSAGTAAQSTLYITNSTGCGTEIIC